MRRGRGRVTGRKFSPFCLATYALDINEELIHCQNWDVLKSKTTQTEDKSLKSCRQQPKIEAAFVNIKVMLQL